MLKLAPAPPASAPTAHLPTPTLAKSGSGFDPLHTRPTLLAENAPSVVRWMPLYAP